MVGTVGTVHMTTYSPVGCSYFPVWGVSKCCIKDMMDEMLDVYLWGSRYMMLCNVV